MNEKEKPIDDLIHDVRSKCATLSDGSEALRDASPERRLRLLSLMLVQARHVVDVLAAFEAETVAK